MSCYRGTYCHMMGNKEPENEFMGTGNIVIHSFGKHCSSRKQKADIEFTFQRKTNKAHK